MAALAMSIPFAGCGQSDSSSTDYGPLAVIDDSDTAPEGGHDALGGTGELDITDRCVRLKADDDRRLVLVWRASEVRWDDGRIVFTGSDGEVRLADGDTLTVGGSSLEYEGEAETRPDRDWAQEPDADCDGELWSVHSLTVG